MKKAFISFCFSILFGTFPFTLMAQPQSKNEQIINTDELQKWDNFLKKHYGNDFALVPSEALQLKELESNETLETVIAQSTQNSKYPMHLRFDAARALIYFAKNTSNIELSVKLLSQIDFSKVDKSEWLFLCQKAAQKNAIILPCAKRILDEKEFEFPILGTGRKSDKSTIFVLLLLNMPEQQWNRWTQDLLWMGKYYKNPSSEKALAYAVFYAVSLRGDAILSKISDDKTRSNELRNYVNQLLIQIHSMEKWSKNDIDENKRNALYKELKISPKINELELRKQRQILAKELSAENLTKIERITFLIRSKAIEYWTELQKKGKL